MSDKLEIKTSDFSLKPGFEIQKRLDAIPDSEKKAFIDALPEQHKNYLKTYRSNRKFYEEDFRKQIIGKSPEEVRAYTNSLSADNKEFLRHERARQRAAVPTPEKVDAIVKQEKEQEKLFIDERTPEVSFLERLGLKSVGDQRNLGEALRRTRPDLDVINHKGNTWVKRKDETNYKALDPSFKPLDMKSWDWEDLTDVAGDFVQGAAEGLGAGVVGTGAGLAALSNPVTAPLAPAAVAAGGVTGGASVGGAFSAGKQALAKALGYQDEIDTDEIKTEAALGGAFSLLPGGKTFTKGMKDTVGSVGKKTAYDKNLNKIKVPIGEEGADKVLHPFRKKGEAFLDYFREKSTGMNPRALQLGREYPDYIAQVQSAAKAGYDPVIESAREIRKNAAKQLDDLKKYTYAKKEAILSSDETINTSELRKSLVGAYKTKRKEQQKIYGKKVPEGAKEETKLLKSIYENLPRKTNDINIKTADDIKSRLNNIVAFEPNDTKDVIAAKAFGKKFTKKFEDKIGDTVPTYKDANAQYAQVADFEDNLKSANLVEENLDKVKRRPKKIEGLKPPKAYTESERKAVESLTKATPALTQNLKGLDKFTRQLAYERASEDQKKIMKKGLNKAGPLEKAYEKKVALKQWLPKEKNPVLPGESRKGTLTNTLATLGVGGAAATLGSPWALLPTAAYMAAMTPTGVLKQYQLGKAMKESVPLKYGLGLQPTRVLGGNTYEALRKKEDDLYGTKK